MLAYLLLLDHMRNCVIQQIRTIPIHVFQEAFVKELERKPKHNISWKVDEYVIGSVFRNKHGTTFQDLALIHSIEMSFFATSAGYIGKSLPCIQGGDLVVPYSGVDVPMIMRKAGITYRLRAPAYIHGIMHGEKWPSN